MKWKEVLGTKAVRDFKRAEYGMLKNVIDRIDKSEKLELCLMVTGTHFVPEYGMTIKEIEQDGYLIAERIDVLMIPTHRLLSLNNGIDYDVFCRSI